MHRSIPSHVFGITVACTLFCFTSGIALAGEKANPTTTTCPAINTSKGFFGNFNNPCYAVPLTSGTGSTLSGDPNATYDEVYYQVNPGYQLIVYGIYPNARFLSATVYDSHLAVTSSMTDASILPLTAAVVNPLLPGAKFVPGQYYGLTISFGGGNPQTVSPGCSTTSSTVGQNLLDASQIHQGLSWNGWTGPPALPIGFPPHVAGANTGGLVMIRKYLDIDNPITPENVIVRSLSNGCAITAAQAEQMNIISPQQSLKGSWLNQPQMSAHQEFTTGIQPSWCFPADPTNSVVWQRSTDYIALNDNYAGYLNAPLSVLQTTELLTQQHYLRMQFQMPSTPDTPCTNGTCSLTGNEQVRYVSVGFIGPEESIAGAVTLFAVADTDLVKDPNGNVTMVVGLGAPQPSFATAANYYTWVDLSGILNINTITGIRVRNLIPNASFDCSTLNVPYQTSEFNPSGGYMGNYVPTVDFPTLAQLPVNPVPIVRKNSCALTPTASPVACPYTDALTPLSSLQ